MDALKEIFPVILYGLLIILVIVLIIFAIRLIKTLSKVDEIVDDVNAKMKKVDGVFTIVDSATGAINSFGDKLNYVVTSGINSILSKRKNKKEEREEEEE